MKQIILIIACLLAASAVSAQKVVRDSIRLGNKAFTEQRYQEAERNFRSALERDPKSKEASFNLANTYYKQSKWDEALKEYQHYLTIESENPVDMSSAWHNIGNTLLKKKELKQSMDAYKNALRLNPADEESRYNLAVVQKILKDQEDNQDNQDQKQDQQQQQQDKQQQDQQQNQNQQNQQQKKPEEQQDQQVSRESANQILQAIEQDEKETQERVKQMKAAEKQRQNEDNKRQNKDW